MLSIGFTWKRVCQISGTFTFYFPYDRRVKPLATMDLSAPVLSCVCGCEDYESKSPENSACRNCECPAISHSLLKTPGVEGTGEYQSLGQLIPPGDSLTSPAAPGGKKKMKKKRGIGELGADSTESVLKKAKMSTSEETGRESGIFSLKACKVLERGHLHFAEIENIPYSARGVYKVAYDYKTIYVGTASCQLRPALKGHFAGTGNKDLYDFIKTLSQKDLEKVSVFWLNEESYTHSCKRSYLKCIEESERSKPRFNCSVPKKSAGGWCTLM